MKTPDTFAITCRGFSLLELSVVIAIITMMIGAVMAGNTLMVNAERRALLDEVQQYRQAITDFETKYAALPGDFPTATAIWGIAAGATGSNTTCFEQDSSLLANPRLTCNGNGDGWIESATMVYTNEWTYSERYRAWQHLANGGFIGGSFMGRSVNATPLGMLPDQNVPQTLKNKGYFQLLAITYIPDAADSQWFTSQKQVNLIGYERGAAPLPKEFSAKDFLAIDSKVDDGRPGYGSVISTKSTHTAQPDCTSTDDPTTAEYNVAEARKLCGNLYFTLGGTLK